MTTDVNKEQERLYGPKRVHKAQILDWIGMELRRNDTVVEMTTTTWEMVYLLEGHVDSVTVVETPDHIEYHLLAACPHCQTDLPTGVDCDLIGAATRSPRLHGRLQCAFRQQSSRTGY